VDAPLDPTPTPIAPSLLQRTTLVRETARSCGLPIVAITSAAPFEDLAPFLQEHVAAGRVEGLPWFTVQRAMESLDPSTIHPGPRSIVSVGLPYHVPDTGMPEDGVPRGRIARYARGEDYHRVLRQRMDHFVEVLSERLGQEIVSRRVTDTARMVDRAVAARAGLGWYGKNACIIVPGHSSWVVLGEIVLDLELAHDLPLAMDCGRCTICIDRCPTGAITAPYTIDSRRCLSFHTIEQRGAIPREIRPLLGDWVFGCDVCQDTCPWSGAAREASDTVFTPRSVANAYPDLGWLVRMSEKEFREAYGGTPVIRAKRRGLARNAAVALGNAQHDQAEAHLLHALAHHDEPLVRLHAAWALSRHPGRSAYAALERARTSDPEPDVRDEAAWALETR